MNIENLGEDVLVLNFTPIAFDWSGEIVAPRNAFEHFILSYLFPLTYDAGEIGLQEGQGLSEAIKTTRGCRAFDGGGVVWSIVRAKNGGRKVKEVNPWGRKPPSSAAPLDEVRAPDLVQVGAHGG